MILASSTIEETDKLISASVNPFPLFVHGTESSLLLVKSDLMINQNYLE